MAYVRKTQDEWTLQGNYGGGTGWEDLTSEDTRKEIMQRKRDYLENEAPYMAVQYRVICRRIPIAA